MATRCLKVRPRQSRVSPPNLRFYPTRYGYVPAEREITVGDGRFGPVAPEVWAFEVSGHKVIQSWLGYRMKERAGKEIVEAR